MTATPVNGLIAQGMGELASAMGSNQGQVAAVYPLPNGQWFILLKEKPPTPDRVYAGAGGTGSIPIWLGEEALSCNNLPD